MGPDGGNEVAAVQVVVLRCVYFFFSSRRRHTRCSRDWSSTCALPILGGLYPSSCLYMRTAWVDSHKAQVQRSEEHTSELQSRLHLVCRLLLEKKKNSTRLRTS